MVDGWGGRVDIVYKVEKVEEVHSIEKVKETENVSIVVKENIKTDGKTFLQFACSNGFIAVKELQLEGKKKMNIEEFLRGYRFP